MSSSSRASSARELFLIAETRLRAVLLGDLHRRAGTATRIEQLRCVHRRHVGVLLAEGEVAEEATQSAQPRIRSVLFY